MKRFVLRFRGVGKKPKAEVTRIQSLPGLKVLDNASNRMMLVEAQELELLNLMREFPQWVMSEEQKVPLPDTRQNLRTGM